ncbi:SPW repeat domain-containing protein [Salinarimonas soli]|uniref:SPW repeat domain-containing protein n=1 Tax=Salinarimonas soli TaxID=1638099 RepID=UPI001AEE6CA1|nr:hypothetical protein [Salinarimonas soli]
MRFLPTRVHGIIDYVWGALAFATPWALGFAGGTEGFLLMFFGVAAFAYSFATDYEWGVIPVLSVPAHLAVDGAGGLFLMAAPWLFGFADRVHWSYLAFGGFSVVASLVTRTKPAGR